MKFWNGIKIICMHIFLIKLWYLQLSLALEILNLWAHLWASPIVVADYASGCADGSTEGLSHFEGVQACGGAWRGHVKRGRHLCARGWHVCSARHAGALKLITWTDATLVDGCYAYNAANKLSSCSRWVKHLVRHQVATSPQGDCPPGISFSLHGCRRI